MAGGKGSGGLLVMEVAGEAGRRLATGAASSFRGRLRDSVGVDTDRGMRFVDVGVSAAFVWPLVRRDRGGVDRSARTTARPPPAGVVLGVEARPSPELPDRWRVVTGERAPRRFNGCSCLPRGDDTFAVGFVGIPRGRNPFVGALSLPVVHAVRVRGWLLA